MNPAKVSILIGESRATGKPEVIASGDAGEVLSKFNQVSGTEYADVYFIRGLLPFKRKKFVGEVIPTAPVTILPPATSVEDAAIESKQEEEGAGDSVPQQNKPGRKKRAADIIG